MRFRMLFTAIALSSLFLGSGCCCNRPFRCWRPFRCCHLRGSCACESCCGSGVSEGAVSYSPMLDSTGSCDGCGSGAAEPPVYIQPVPAPGGAPISPMPKASSGPLPGPGPLTRSK